MTFIHLKTVVVRIQSPLLGVALATFIIAACARGGHPGLQSGGLGLTRSEWQQLHGSAASQDSGYVNYNDDRGRFTINFMDGNAGYIKRTYQEPTLVSIEDARRESRNLMPTDCTLIRTYQVSAGSVDLYSSESLKSFFPSDEDWLNGEPGQFIVLYFSEHDFVDSYVVALGNNP
ncbi:MAG TPA: hypothetical protein VKN18_07425 [Blastocatellia bacterium]|nr:hypothetical protein [Blastocatellia bacterium]